MMRYAIMVSCLLFLHGNIYGQKSRYPYTDTAKYYFVDSIAIPGNIVWYVGYFRENDESVLIRKHGTDIHVFPGFLTCYLCQGRGSDNPTYTGHTIAGKTTILTQQYFNGIDSVYLNMYPVTPVIEKIVRRSYDKNSKPDPDYPGNYCFTPRQATPITKIAMPVDRQDDTVKKYFRIERIPWHRLQH